MIISKNNALYLTNANGIIQKHQDRSIIFKKIGTFFLTFFMFITFLTGSLSSNLIHADDNDQSKDIGPVLQKAADDFAKANHLDPKQGFLDFVNSVQHPAPDTFGTVLIRLFTIKYINRTTTGVPTGGGQAHDWNCNANDPNKNTPLYHNCDIPNPLTEALQNVLSLIIPSGPQNAITSSAKSPNGIGIPSTIPNDGQVPIDPNQRNIKYTALEIIGYTPKYTGYLGEWDHIKVLTPSKVLSNFSMMDDINLTAQATVNSITKGMKVSTNRSLDHLKKGDILGAIAGAYTGFFDGAATATVTTILDTYDLSIFNSYAWYRVDYGGTLYNARELSETEQSAIIKSYMSDLFNSLTPADAKLPADFSKLEPGPPKPKENISKCTVPDPNDSTKTIEIKLDGDSNGGINEEDCKQKAKEEYNGATPTWSVDGNQKKETLADWKKNNKDFLDKGSKENIKCDMKTTEDTRSTNIAQFYVCWDKAYKDAVQSKMSDQQNKENQTWVDKVLQLTNVIKFLLDPNHKSRNFNAPWSKFVCTDAQGKDLISNKDNTYHNRFIFLYDDNKNLNNACKAPRPPIQNGMFGNGYDTSQPNQQPGIDTRNAIFYGDGNIFGKFVSPSFLFGSGNSLGDVGLQIAETATMISNTIIDLGFSPILEKLGITKMLITLVEAFRDSIFFPFIYIIVALGALQIFFSTAKNRNYQQGFISLLLIVAVACFGILVLYNPKKVFDTAEDVPSQVETAILGSIFGTGNSDPDNLCTATQTTTTSGTGLDGKTLSFSPRASTRMLECNVWRTFVFNPWVLGQWGTTYDNLYSASSTNPSHFTNTNTDLVGEPTVNLGGGTTVKNWALYQLDILKTGTSTTEDYSVTNGHTPRNFYKLVDLQAGPDNAAKSDGRYFNYWNGVHAQGRDLVGALSAVVAIIATITICSFMLFKIEISLMFALMLLMLPFVLLIGIHPTFGRLQLKKYGGSLLSLLLQRIFLITLFALLIRILLAFTNTRDYFLSAFLCIALCMAALIYRKELLGLVSQSVSSHTGGLLGSDKVNNPESMFNKLVPETIQNQIQLRTARVVGGAGGAVGAIIAGGSAREGYKYGAGRERRFTRNRLLRSGKLSGLSQLNEARESAKNYAQKEENTRKKQRRENNSDRSPEKRILQQIDDYNNRKENERIAEESKQFLKTNPNKTIDDIPETITKRRNSSAYLDEHIKIDLSNPKNTRDLIAIEKADYSINQLSKEINARGNRIGEMRVQQGQSVDTYQKEIHDATADLQAQLDKKIAEKDVIAKRLAERNDDRIDHKTTGADDYNVIKDKVSLKEQKDINRAVIAAKKERINQDMAAAKEALNEARKGKK